jgi:hypothetical protein
MDKIAALEDDRLVSDLQELLRRTLVVPDAARAGRPGTRSLSPRSLICCIIHQRTSPTGCLPWLDDFAGKRSSGDDIGGEYGLAIILKLFG